MNTLKAKRPPHPNYLERLTRLPKTGLFRACEIKDMTHLEPRLLKDWAKLHGFPVIKTVGRAKVYDMVEVWGWIEKNEYPKS